MRNKSICIVGGAGFVGINLVSLLNDSNGITIIDKGDIKDHLYLNKFKLDEYYNFNQTSFQGIDEKEFDYIFYLAGNSSIQRSIKDPLFDFNSNIMTLIKFLEKIKYKSTKIIYFSSAAVYGEMSDNKANNIPVSPYGLSKFSSEKYLQYFSSSNGNDILICRPFSLFGKYCRKQVVYDTALKLIKTPSRIEVYDSGSIRDFIFIEDALDIILMLCKSNAFRSEPYDVGMGLSTNIFELTNLISKVLGIEPDVRHVESSLLGNPQVQISSVEYLNGLGFNFKYSLESRIKQTVDWIKDKNE